MESILLYGDKDKNVVFENTDIPQIKDHEVLVRIRRAGICGTDLKLYSGSYHTQNNSFPVVLGHEFIGEVVEIGDKVTKVEVGNRVVAHPTYSSCGQCRYCHTGEFNLCNQRKRIGFDYDGVFAEFTKLDESQVYLVPNHISDNAGALIEPLTVAVRGVYKAEIKPTDTVLVIGPGAIGLLTALVVKQTGARVIVCGTNKDTERMEIARQMGIDMTSTSHELPKRLKQKDIQVDVVFECSGNEHAVSLGLNILCPKGQFIQIGTASTKLNVSFMDIAYKELKVTGSIAAIKEDWHTAIQLMEELESKALLIVKECLPLKEFKRGFEECLQNGGPKVLFSIHPNEGL